MLPTKKWHILSCLQYIVFIFCFCFSLTVSGKEVKWRLGLKDIAQAENAGFYMADATGAFKQLGLQVQLIHPTWEQSSEEMLFEGKVDFAMTSLDSILSRIRNHEELVILAQFTTKSPHVLITSIKGIETQIYKLNGKKLATAASRHRPGIVNFLKQLGVKAQYIKARQGYMAMLHGAAEATEALSYKELELLPFYGKDVKDYSVFPLHEYGLIMPEYVLYTKLSVWKQYPSDCKKLLAASVEGWKRSFEHPAAALIRIQNACIQNKIPFSYAQQKAQLQVLSKIIVQSPQASGIGLEAFQQTARLMEWRLMPERSSQLYHTLVPLGKQGIPPYSR